MLFLAFLAHIWTASAYIWPSAQLDALEAARFDQAGHNAGRIAGFVQPCDVFFLGDLDSTGRSNVGDWLRTVGGSSPRGLEGKINLNELIYAGIP
jgi:hypothetical protein